MRNVPLSGGGRINRIEFGKSRARRSKAAGAVFDL
jgi:hypothetical protein